MVGSLDVEDLLQTGHFTTTRARSPRPHSANPPVRANQSSKLDPHIPRSFSTSLLRRYPPPPCVEDEAEALAKEYGSDVSAASREEEPKNRGDVEQQPILLPMPEFNPERRFVLVTDSADSAVDSGDDYADSVVTKDERPPKKASEYEANTCRKYTVPRLDTEDSNTKKPGVKPETKPETRPEAKPEARSEAKPEVKRRKSRQDLPRIETEFESNRSPGLYRTRSATYIDERAGDRYDHEDRPERPSQDSGLLTPSIIKHSTKGRDRAYFDFNPGKNGSSTRARSDDPRVVSEDKYGHDRHERPSLSASPVIHKRANSTVDAPKVSRRPSLRRGDRKNSSPPRLDRRTSSPPRERERQKLGRSGSYRRRRESPSSHDDDYSSDDYARDARRHRHDRRKSIVNQEAPNHMLSPDSVRPPLGGRSMSRGNTTPLASPRHSQNQLLENEPMPGPRSSTTFPPARERRRHDERPVSPFSSASSSSPRSRSRFPDEERPKGPRPRSRAPSIHMPAMPPASPPIPIPAETTRERRKSQAPPPLMPLVSSAAAAGTLARVSTPPSRSGSFESSPPKVYWNPAPYPQSFEPIESFRRYSEDVSLGNIPGLPPCPRQIPRAGFSDWLTFPRCDNFNVCPYCYDSLFANTDFRTHLVLAPFRPADKKIACDMGSSHWYRIAWLMTKKYQLPDLRLLKGIADAAAKHAPCMGKRKANRVWLSIRDPYSSKPVPDFNVCSSCAKSVEVLFPNLVSIFQPVEPHGAVTKAVCALHYAPDRRRFFNYFDLLESTSDKALASKTSPNIESLFKNLRRVSTVDECTRDDVVEDGEWYMMRDLPGFTVCEECFDEVVYPEVREDSAVARNFYKEPQRLRAASCQLYSPRMRDVFLRACRKNNFDFLESKVNERRDMETVIRSRLARLQDAKVPNADAEAERLLLEWKKWE